jgi:hypothetical protein
MVVAVPLAAGLYRYLPLVWAARDTAVSMTISPPLVDAGVRLAWRGDRRIVLHPGQQHFRGSYGENDVLLLCPSGREIEMGGWFSINWRHGIDALVSCGGTPDAIRCAFLTSDQTTWRDASCTRPPPLPLPDGTYGPPAPDLRAKKRSSAASSPSRPGL